MGDLWGGLASTLVALPASIAFGVAVYTPLGLGPGVGALAGLLGAVALGTLAPALGGTPRLISAPCAPAVAVLGAFTLELAKDAPSDPGRVVVLMTLVGLLAAGLQIALGLARAGTVIKYIPYPVVAGYLSGVGVVILLKQLPALFGLPGGTPLWTGLTTPSSWAAPSLAVGGATIAVTLLAPRVTRAVPPAILGLAAGALAYAALALGRPELRTLAGNALVIGPLGGAGASLGEALGARLSSLGGLRPSDLLLALGPATTLGVVLSLDTLKTCVVVDAVTGGRHESNRELFGQGVANTVSALIGGMPGAGTSGATLLNLASGAQTRWSGIIEGGLVLLAFLALGGVVAWAPLAALAGILAVVAVRMFDWSVLRWARQRSTALDFAVVLVVIAVAVGVDLITASGVGVALSMLLFIRNESRGAVIRRRLHGNQIFSRRRRLPEQAAVLAQHGEKTAVVQLQGALFFGTTDQLRTLLADDLERCETLILDLRRVDALDLTAAHILEQMEAQLSRRGAHLLLCELPRGLSGGRAPAAYLRELGLIHDGDQQRLFAQLSDALGWAEDRILAAHGVADPVRPGPLRLEDLPVCVGRRPETVADLASCLEERSVPAGQLVFRHGDEGDELYFIRRGTVRISLPMEGKDLHLASFGRRDFFGEIAFLDGGRRSADAVAETDTELFVLSRKRFEAVADAHPRLAHQVFFEVSRTLALRLRQADRSITSLEEA